MINLDLIRAGHAIRHCNGIDRNDVQKLPALIINNGLLAATAFTLDSEARSGMKTVMNIVAQYLAEHGFIASNISQAKGIIDDLTMKGRDPLALQRATTETLDYLGYLKRFADKKGGGKSSPIGKDPLGVGKQQPQA